MIKKKNKSMNFASSTCHKMSAETYVHTTFFFLLRTVVTVVTSNILYFKDESGPWIGFASEHLKIVVQIRMTLN